MLTPGLPTALDQALGNKALQRLDVTILDPDLAARPPSIVKVSGTRAGMTAGRCDVIGNGGQLEPAERTLWHALRGGTDDPLLRQDAERLTAVLAQRRSDQNWADSVAGDMERHYSPGRTWEALARAALPMLDPGEVLDVASGDGVLAELLAGHFWPRPDALSERGKAWAVGAALKMQF